MTPPIVKRYLLALGRYKWPIPVVGALGLAGASFVAMQPLPDPSVRSVGKLNYTRPPISFTTTGTQIQQEGQDLTEDVILADDVLKKVSDAIKIPPDKIRPKIKVELPDPPTGGGRANTPPSNRLISFGYNDTEEKRALLAMDTLLKAVQEKSKEVNTSRLRAVIKNIDQRLPEVERELKAAEQRLEQYDKREGPAILAAQNGTLIAGITGAQGQQRQLQQTLLGVVAQMNSLQKKLGLNPDAAYVSSALSADPILADLRTQIYQAESQLTTLSRDLREEHPRMIELRRQKGAFEQLYQQRAQEVIGGNGIAAPFIDIPQLRQSSSLDPTRQQLANTLVSLQTQQETLVQQILQARRTEQELRQEYANIPNKQLERARLEQQVTLKKALFDKMQDKLVDSKAAEAETVSSLELTSGASIGTSTKPSKNVPVTLAAGLVLGLLVGGGLVFLLDMLEGTIYTLEDAQQAFKQREVPLLGVLPLIETLNQEGEAPVLLEPNSPYLDFYERFRSNLRRLEEEVKVVMVTSASPQEGKTVSAYNLAIASARAGKRTLLIEMDLRSPSRAQMLRVSPDPDSLVEPLLYYGEPGDCIRLVPDVQNLYVLPSPGPQRYAAAIIESSELKRLLEDVRSRFDFVVLDAPALSASNDTLLLEPFTDGIVLSARPGFTKSSMLGEAVQQLTEAEDVQFLGGIVSGAEINLPKEMYADENEDALLTESETLEDEEDYEEVMAGGRNT
jgi:capsular exopolysaccharide synthesis family protein